ncbi:hypothetical protein WJX81_001342 [Elliptochloris bilobata]|uniref:Uncharacterized protein n=1 Tax=Elliptochloris bilobata TaxID=381761 RepID=A0AAW1R1P7_9CHLO
MGIPAAADIEAFEDRVSEVSRLVDGLRTGALSADYVAAQEASDEEDEALAACPPSSPAFRALERDIDRRHQRMVEQRQVAERQRVAGNAALKAGRPSEAYQAYAIGLDAERHNAALHANAALASLRMRAYVQAIEHCDKVLHIQDCLHGAPYAPICTKALHRRALARARAAALDLLVATALHPGMRSALRAAPDLSAPLLTAAAVLLGSPRDCSAAAALLGNLFMDSTLRRQAHCGVVLRTRTAGVLARVAQAPGGAQRLREAGAASAVRALAACATADPASAAALATAVGIGALLGALEGGGPAAKGTAGVPALAAEEAAANAALCLAGMSALPSALAALHAADAAAALVEAAHKRTGAAQKNSAIALARMAKLPACLQRIRELHGIEIMCRYVKP